MANTYELTLSDFEFPKNLPNDKANFRFVASIRYTNKNDEFTTESAVLPGADIYWECDEGKSGDPNFVRGDDAPNGNGTFDTKKIDAWNKLISEFPIWNSDSNMVLPLFS